METVLEPLTQSPKLCLYLRELEALLEDEHARRQQFYEHITEEEKVEFINGEVVMHSPVKLQHNRVSVLLSRLLSTYVSMNQLGFVGHEKILISLTRNDYEPDICFFTSEKADTFTPGQWQFPPPDFVVEVLSPGTEQSDRTTKFMDYAAHDVREYWIIDPDAETVEQYLLEQQQYTLRLKVRDGSLESQVLAGFTIPVRAIFDEQENLNVLQKFFQNTGK